MKLLYFLAGLVDKLDDLIVDLYCKFADCLYITYLKYFKD